MHHERVIAAMDKEVEEARVRHDQLKTARDQYAAAHGVTNRRRTDDHPGEGSLMSVFLRVMANGAFWQVADVVTAIETSAGRASRGSINGTLARGALPGGPLERGPRRGTYRVRPDVVTTWGCAANVG